MIDLNGLKGLLLIYLTKCNHLPLEIGVMLLRIDQAVTGRSRRHAHLSAKNVPNAAQHDRKAERNNKI